MAIINATNETFSEDVKEGLVLVDFWAAWCGPCKMIAPVLDEIDAEMGDKVKVVKVNVEEASAVSAQFGIQSIPTLLLFKNGEVVDKTMGFKPKEALAEFIEQHI